MPPKRHHYVPIWYQAPFTIQRDGKKLIYVYDKENTDADPRLQQPVNTGVEGRLYSSANQDGNEISLEEDFAGIETQMQPILDAWISDPDRRDEGEKEALPFFIGHILMRSPRMINQVAESQEAASVAIFRKLASQPPEAQEKMFQELKSQGKLKAVESVGAM